MGCNESKDQKDRKNNPNTPNQKPDKDDTLPNQPEIKISSKPPENPLEENNEIKQNSIEVINNIPKQDENIILGSVNEKRDINNIKGEMLTENKEEEIPKSLLQIDNEEYSPDYIGKLCFDPLLLFIFNSKTKTFHMQKYENSLQDFENLNNTASFCNGINRLFASGGSDINGNITNLLYVFDLVDYNVEGPIEIPSKINHSMIYIPKKYIFIVGGNDEKTFYYDINEKKIENWGDLNKKRIEPALIQINNILYVFDNVNKDEINNDFELTFEKTDLLSSQPKWEIIKPELSRGIIGSSFIPKYFGVAKKSDNEIIFIGGNSFDSLEENENPNEAKNYEYNIENNIIKYSELPFVNISLKEKTFFSFNKKNDVYYLLPDFYKMCPQVVFYAKNKNKLKVIDYKRKNRNGEKEIFKTYNNPNIQEGNNKYKSYNFNMPKITEKIEEHYDVVY